MLYIFVPITNTKYANKINFLSYFTEIVEYFKIRLTIIKLIGLFQSYKFFNILSHGFPNISMTTFKLVKCKLNLHIVLLI